MSSPSCDLPGLGLRVGADQVPDPAHDNPAFQTLLVNAVRWAGGKAER